MSFDVSNFRKNFPQLERRNGPKPLVYFDSAASTLKHNLVTERLNSYNRFETANVHRGAHLVSRQGTTEYENSRLRLSKFINAADPKEIIFTKGTTESINLLAHCLKKQLKEDDEILISSFEHHSNIVPWQVLCAETGCKLKVVPLDKEVGFNIQSFKDSITAHTKVASVLMYSNSIGQRLPLEEIATQCQARGIVLAVDAAQALLSETIDVQKIGCDFLAFSAHKMFGPYGTGILYGKKNQLKSLDPYQTGGSMIDRVSFEKTTYADIPQKFEAGTPNISSVIGFGAAVQAVLDMDVKLAHSYVQSLRDFLKEGLNKIDSCEIYDFPSSRHSGALSFNIKGAHPSDVGTLLDKYGIAVRAGHHCTQPLMDLLGVPGTVRVSLAPYNTNEEVDLFLQTMKKIEEFF